MQFDNISKNLGDVSNNADTRFQEISKYIRFVDGNIVLGEAGSELILKIANDRISFCRTIQKLHISATESYMLQMANTQTAYSLASLFLSREVMETYHSKRLWIKYIKWHLKGMPFSNIKFCDTLYKNFIFLNAFNVKRNAYLVKIKFNSIIIKCYKTLQNVGNNRVYKLLIK